MKRRNAVRTILAAALGAVLGANGAFMLLAPTDWYGTVPGVPDTGPLNAHFVRDIGAMFLLSGVAFVWLARSAKARGAALFATGFLALHSLIHLGDAIATGHFGHLAHDLPGVFAPTLVAIWLTLTPRARSHAKEANHASLGDQAADPRL